MHKALFETAGVLAKGSDQYPPFELNVEPADKAREFGARNGRIKLFTELADVDAA